MKGRPRGLVLLEQRLPHEGARFHELGVGDGVVDGLALFARPHQKGLPQDAEMLRDVVDGDAEIVGDVADPALAFLEAVHDGEAVLARKRLAHLGVHLEEGTHVH